uniref:RxLR effector protein n=1 Tax=Rhabditophanes sp. KR3021 TaxID=114890 RepID=A0AC35TTP4_9BILA
MKFLILFATLAVALNATNVNSDSSSSLVGQAVDAELGEASEHVHTIKKRDTTDGLKKKTNQNREHLMQIRKDYNVYSFTQQDYPAIFAIFLGISLILVIAIIFIAVGMWTMDPGKDSIIYRMTTTKLKKD